MHLDGGACVCMCVYVCLCEHRPHFNEEILDPKCVCACVVTSQGLKNMHTHPETQTIILPYPCGCSCGWILHLPPTFDPGSKSCLTPRLTLKRKRCRERVTVSYLTNWACLQSRSTVLLIVFRDHLYSAGVDRLPHFEDFWLVMCFRDVYLSRHTNQLPPVSLHYLVP